MAQALPEYFHHILDLARWAPSSDNTRPWRFEIPGEREHDPRSGGRGQSTDRLFHALGHVQLGAYRFF